MKRYLLTISTIAASLMFFCSQVYAEFTTNIDLKNCPQLKNLNTAVPPKCTIDDLSPFSEPIQQAILTTHAQINKSILISLFVPKNAPQYGYSINCELKTQTNSKVMVRAFYHAGKYNIYHTECN